MKRRGFFASVAGVAMAVCGGRKVTIEEEKPVEEPTQEPRKWDNTTLLEPGMYTIAGMYTIECQGGGLVNETVMCELLPGHGMTEHELMEMWHQPIQWQRFGGNRPVLFW